MAQCLPVATDAVCVLPRKRLPPATASRSILSLVGLVAGNANVSFAGSTQQAPFIYGDIFGGGNLAQVANDTYVNIYAGNIAGQVFGGGNGDITDDTVTSADVLGNTNVTLAQDEGGTQSAGHGPIDDSLLD